MSTARPPRYLAYLLRCWRGEQPAPRGSSPLRSSPEEILYARRRRGFGSLEALLNFLQAELASVEEEAATGPRKEVP